MKRNNLEILLFVEKNIFRKSGIFQDVLIPFSIILLSFLFLAQQNTYAKSSKGNAIKLSSTLFSGNLPTPECEIVTSNFSSLADGTTSDPSSTGWYIDASNVPEALLFAVKSNRFHAENLGGEGIWYSRVMSTAGNTEFQVSIKVHSEGLQTNSEYVKVYYKVDGGTETLLEELTGNFGTLDLQSPVLYGSNVQLIVKMYNYDNGSDQTSKYHIEEYRVYKEGSPCAGDISISASASNNGVLTCDYTTLTLSATSSENDATYSWTGPNSFSSNEQSPSVSTPGTYNVTATSALGTASTSIQVTEDKNLPDFSISGGNILNGVPVALTVSTSVTNCTFSWSGPYGFSSSEQNPEVSEPGTYTLTLLNLDNGCTDSKSVVVSSTSSGCASIGTIWLEDFNTLTNGTAVDNGATSWSTQDPGTGTFSVQDTEFEITFPSANEGIWTSESIDISGLSNVSISVDVRSSGGMESDGSDYLRVYYILNNGSEQLIYENLGSINGNSTSYTQASIESLEGNTLKVVIYGRVTYSDEIYNFDNVTVTGTSQSDIVATVSADGNLSCNNNTVNITAEPSATGYTYSWSGPNGYSADTQVITVNESGDYIVTVTSSEECTGTATTNIVRTSPDNIVAYTSIDGSLSCGNTSVTITGSSNTSDVSYRWSGPNGYSANTQVINVSEAGDYILTISHNDGCTATATATVTSTGGSSGIIWLEDFNDLSDGTTSDNGSTAWSIDDSGINTGYMQVTSQRFVAHGSGTDSELGLGVWISEVIDISSYSDVTLSVFLEGEGSLDTGEDYIRVYFKLNGGSETLFINGDKDGAFTSGTVSSPVLSGNTVQIVIRTQSTGDSEYYYYDNITVTGTGQSVIEAIATADGILTCETNQVTLLGSSTAPKITSYSWTGPNNFISEIQNPMVNEGGNYTLTVEDIYGCQGIATVNVIQDTEEPGATASVIGQLSCAITSVTLSGNSGTSGASYEWTGPNGFSSTLQSPEVNMLGTYTLTVTNQENGCSSSAIVQVTAVEAGSPVTFWLEEFPFADGTTSDDGSTSWSIEQTGAGVFSVQNNEFKASFDGAAEGSWASGIIDISSKSNVMFSVDLRSETGSTDDYFEDDDYFRVYYKLDNGSEVLVFEDYNGIGSTTNTTGSITVTSGSLNASTLQIIIKARNSHSTERYFFDNIEVSGSDKTVETITASASGVLTCKDTIVTITASPEVDGVFYNWSGPNGFLGDQAVVDAGDAGEYILIVSGTNACVSNDTLTVNVSQNIAYPGATAEAGGQLTCNTLFVTLTGYSPTSGVKYNWNGPDNISSSSPTLLTDIPGNYSVIVTDTVNGCSSEASTQVMQNITPPTDVIGTASDTLSCIITSVKLIGSSSSDGIIFTWRGPDNFTSSEEEPDISIPGIYLLTATDTANGCKAYDDVPVFQNITPPANVSITGNGSLNCNSSSITLSGSSATQEVSFEWNGPDGFTASSQTITIDATGLYELSVKDTLNGCVSITNITIARDTLAPEVTISASDKIDCNTFYVTLGANSQTPGVSYGWAGPSGYISTQQNPVTTVPGNYTVTATNPINGCVSFAEINVEEDLSAPEGVSISVPGVLDCETNSVILSGASSTSSVSYSWSGPDGFVSMMQNPEVFNPGNYTLVVQNTINNCKTTANAVVELTQSFPENVTAKVSGILSCSDNSVTISGSSTTNGVIYTWTGPNNFTAALQEASVTIPGDYILEVSIPTNNCKVVETVKVNQNILPPANVNASVSGNLDCNNTPVTLTASSSTNGVLYNWTGPLGFVSNKQIILTGFEGEYTVTVTDPSNGCTDAGQVTVTKDECQ